ncbi:unnamed protein product [Rotaria magnacalcarata]|uniref:Uncharacterized protein n=3 Tax=Rotaria magnacalcarata TaxID=392030 RepID=A0A820K0Q7_9BILA|nr:unnamed protein product [Rotaria magnacalcarata]CAF4329859.1 unnamed protein product [Rotaria magnacalcarata]CAF4914911.1 unnamed protein product [Rotaria magnacalcarata]
MLIASNKISRDFMYLEAEKVEQKLTNEQLEYLREYDAMHPSTGPLEVQAIVKQWNIDDYDFYRDLIDWFNGQRFMERKIAILRYDSARVAA